jgi:hypothetical protein
MDASTSGDHPYVPLECLVLAPRLRTLTDVCHGRIPRFIEGGADAPVSKAGTFPGLAFRLPPSGLCACWTRLAASRATRQPVWRSTADGIGRVRTLVEGAVRRGYVAFAVPLDVPSGSIGCPLTCRAWSGLSSGTVISPTPGGAEG